jgi:hypothetical protein
MSTFSMLPFMNGNDLFYKITANKEYFLKTRIKFQIKFLYKHQIGKFEKFYIPPFCIAI